MDLIDKLKAYNTNQLTEMERSEVELLLKNNPHYQEVLNGIKQEQNLQNKNTLQIKWWYAAAAVFIGCALAISTLMVKQNNQLKALMPEEKGLPVFMNTTQKYDAVMNALVNQNFDDALLKLQELPINDTTIYFRGYCFIQLQKNTNALECFTKVSDGYYKEKAQLWIATILIKENKWMEAKRIISNPSSFTELENNRQLLLTYISEND